MKGGLLEQIVGELMDKRLYETVSKDEIYLEGENKIEELTLEMSKLNLPKEQRSVIDKLIDAYTVNGVRYAELAYMQGFGDSSELLRDLDLIKIE